MPFNKSQLIDLRIKHKISMERLAIEANIESSDISRIESGFTKSPRFETIERVADYFVVSMDTFKTDELIKRVPPPVVISEKIIGDGVSSIKDIYYDPITNNVFDDNKKTIGYGKVKGGILIIRQYNTVKF